MKMPYEVDIARAANHGRLSRIPTVDVGYRYRMQANNRLLCMRSQICEQRLSAGNQIVVLVDRLSLFKGQFLLWLAIQVFMHQAFFQRLSILGGSFSIRFDCIFKVPDMKLEFFFPGVFYEKPLCILPRSLVFIYTGEELCNNDKLTRYDAHVTHNG